MLPRRRAFTLVELLIVVAIVATIAAILFPVFIRVADASRGQVCISNFHQVGLATELYTADYDDRMMPVNWQPAQPATSRNDHTWVQNVLPYTRNFAVFHCPSDKTSDGSSEVTFDQDLVPGDTYSVYYTASQHVNTGYNYQYLSPVLLEHDVWTSHPVEVTNIKDPSRMLLFVDSAWSVTNGAASGGGSWLVVPPCRYGTSADGTPIDTFLAGTTAQDAYVNAPGWNLRSSNPGLQFGGAWPRHIGRMTVAYIDGRAGTVSPTQLSAGCDVQPNFTGPIQDPGAYMWESSDSAAELR